MASPSFRPAPLPTVAACVLPLMLLGVIVGCGSSETPTSTSPPTPAASPTPPPPPAPAPPPPAPSAETEPGGPPEEGTPPEENEPDSANPPEGDNTEQDIAPDTEPSDTEPSDTDESSQPTEGTDVVEETSTRPEEIADWKMDDFMTALADEDPKLVEAVEHLGRQFVDTPSAAGLLVRLLEPPQPTEETEAGSQPGYLPPSHQGGSKLNEAIIGALGINNTNESRKILAQLLICKIPTEDEMVTVGFVLKALTEHRCWENEAILLRVLTEAEKLRPQTDGPVTAESLRQLAFEAIKPTASGRLRIELARHLLQPTTPGPRQAMFRPWLEEAKPENLGAQMLLYGHDATPKETKAVLEKHFTQAASTAMGLALRVSTGAAGTSPVAAPGGNAAATSEAPDLDAPYRAVGPLWSPAGVALIEGRLAQLESLETEASLVILASIVPVDSTRTALWQTLDTHWDDGPAGLVSAGLLTQIISDPGIVLLLKSAARKQPSRRVANREAAQKFQETRKSWAQLADDAVKTWCERLGGAALAEPETAPIDLPITLHEDANVSRHYRSDWPVDVQTKLPGVVLGPMEVRYVRIEEKAKFVTTKGFYKRRLSLSEKDLHETDESVRMGSFRIVSGTDRKRSIDLIITRADGPATEEETDPDADDTENLIIEILTIEMKDPESA